MATTYTDVQALASEFEALAPTRINPFIDRAKRRCDASYFGALYDDAVLYLAAHLLAQAERGSAGAAGPVTSKTAGSLSIAYASPAASGVPPEYAGTQWGVEFYRLVRSLAYQASGVL